MKILLVSPQAIPTPPTSYGGIEWIVYHLAYCYAEKGHQVGVVCHPDSQLPPGVEKLAKRAPDVQMPEDAAFKAVADRVKKGDWDIIHDHSHAKRSFVLMREDEDKYKYLTTYHNLSGTYTPVFYPCATAVSQALATYYETEYGFPCKAVLNATDVSSFPFSKEKGDRYLYVGRPWKEKGVLDAVMFCKELNVPLDVVAGRIPGDQAGVALQVARECKEPVWRYWGTVNNETKIELYKYAKALLFPVQYLEPFGLNLIEALSCGTPVVTSDVGPMKEIIKHGETGFIASTPREFKEFMLSVHEIDPEACREDAEKRWNRTRMADDYLALYDRVLKGEKW